MASEPHPTTPQRPLSRRRLLQMAAVGGTGLMLAACTSDIDEVGAASEAGGNPRPNCVLSPEQIEGPFYTDLRLARRDITDDKPGSPLRMRLTIVDAETCAPIPDAVVDVWHADAGGLYSAFTGQGDDQNIDTSGERFLRGIQSTDTNGEATFTTIYPGWYQGRTTHVHVKVHFADKTRVTSQLFFPDDLSAKVYADHPAYTERGPKDTTNDADDFGGAEGELLMAVAVDGDGHTATHTIGIKRS